MWKGSFGSIRSSHMLCSFDLVGTLFATSEIGSGMEELVKIRLPSLTQRLKNDPALVEPLSIHGSNLARVACSRHYGVGDVMQSGEGVA